MYNTIGQGSLGGNIGNFKNSWYWSSSELIIKCLVVSFNNSNVSAVNMIQLGFPNPFLLSTSSIKNMKKLLYILLFVPLALFGQVDKFADFDGFSSVTFNNTFFNTSINEFTIMMNIKFTSQAFESNQFEFFRHGSGGNSFINS